MKPIKVRSFLLFTITPDVFYASKYWMVDFDNVKVTRFWGE